MTLYVVNHLPPESAGVLPGVQRDRKDSLYATLRDHVTLSPPATARVMEAVAAGHSLANHLEVPLRFPLIFIQSVVWNKRKSRSTATAWLRSDRLRIAMLTQV